MACMGKRHTDPYEASLVEEVERFAIDRDWRMDREFVLKGWGRIDLRLQPPGPEWWPIWTCEFKVALGLEEETRQAIRQVSAYRTVSESEGPAFLVAEHIDWDLNAVAHAASFDVKIVSVVGLLRRIDQWKEPGSPVAAQSEESVIGWNIRLDRWGDRQLSDRLDRDGFYDIADRSWFVPVDVGVDYATERAIHRAGGSVKEVSARVLPDGSNLPS